MIKVEIYIDRLKACAGASAQASIFWSWVIDLGPEGGDGGGEIVAWGPPEDIPKAPRSYTDKFLKPVLAKKHDAKKVKKSSEEGTEEAAE